MTDQKTFSARHSPCLMMLKQKMLLSRERLARIRGFSTRWLFPSRMALRQEGVRRRRKMLRQSVDELQGLAWMSRGESTQNLFALSEKAEASVSADCSAIEDFRSY